MQRIWRVKSARREVRAFRSLHGSLYGRCQIRLDPYRRDPTVPARNPTEDHLPPREDGLQFDVEGRGLSRLKSDREPRAPEGRLRGSWWKWRAREIDVAAVGE
jgi:hypothetical protein